MPRNTKNNLIIRKMICFFKKMEKLFVKEEKDKFKKMFMYAIRKKDASSAGHCGFIITELNFLLKELEEEGKIKKRPVVGSNFLSKHYFIKKKL